MSEQRPHTSSSAVVGDVPRELHAAVTAVMRTSRIPGMSVAVTGRDRLLYAAGFGSADLATGEPAGPETPYLWFSMTKIVTATAALRLADDGVLDLDAPVGEHLPYLRAPGDAQPTVRQLLDHTSGLGNPLPLRWVHAADREGRDPEDLLRALMRRRRAHRYPPGQAAHYTNVGYLALGQILVESTGVPFEDLIGQLVLEPVSMHRTGFRHRPDAPAATGYVAAPRIADPLLRAALPNGVVGRRSGRHLALRPFEVDGPAYGGLIGDVVDAARFVQMHLADGQVDGRAVLRPETARVMRVLDRSGEPFTHGLGWFRRPSDGAGDWVEHFGAGAGFWNVMRLYPERGLGVVVMTNSTASYDLEPLMAALVGES